METLVLGWESGMEKLQVEEYSSNPRANQAAQGHRGRPALKTSLGAGRLKIERVCRTKGTENTAK